MSPSRQQWHARPGGRVFSCTEASAPDAEAVRALALLAD
jgi:hypothetical protein